MYQNRESPNLPDCPVARRDLPPADTTSGRPSWDLPVQMKMRVLLNEFWLRPADPLAGLDEPELSSRRMILLSLHPMTSAARFAACAVTLLPSSIPEGSCPLSP
jgi:hypothetical protein